MLFSQDVIIQEYSNQFISNRCIGNEWVKVCISPQIESETGMEYIKIMFNFNLSNVNVEYTRQLTSNSGHIFVFSSRLTFCGLAALWKH